MEFIDGYITKDDVYRLISDYRTFIENEARSKMLRRVKNAHCAFSHLKEICNGCEYNDCPHRNESANSLESSEISKNNSIDHPVHYNTDGIECIDAMRITQGVEAVKDFCILNAFKYLWRYRHKNGTEDVKKAIWYLNKYVELEEVQNNAEIH